MTSDDTNPASTGAAPVSPDLLIPVAETSPAAADNLPTLAEATDAVNALSPLPSWASDHAPRRPFTTTHPNRTVTVHN